MTSLRPRDPTVPFQGTVLLLSSRDSAARKGIEAVFGRTTALRLETVVVGPEDLVPARLAELAARVAEANPCVLLVDGPQAATLAASWEPYYPTPAPRCLRLAATGASAPILEDGSELEAWMHSGVWRGEAWGSRLGVRDGRAVEGAGPLLATLSKLAAAPVELLLGYAKAWPGSDMMGSLALRLGETVWAHDRLARPGTDVGLFTPVSLADHLYGTQSPLARVEVTETIGACYGRNVLGLRLFGESRLALEAMTEEIGRVNLQWRDGLLSAGRILRNVPALLNRAFRSVGWGVSPWWARGPLDLFLALLGKAETTRRAHVLVHYRRVPASESCHRQDVFPWRMWRPWSSESARRRLETKASIRAEATEGKSKLELDVRGYDWSEAISGRGRVAITPGPARASEQVVRLSARQVTHREPEFPALFEDVTRKLLAVTGGQPDRHQALLLSGSGSAAVEASVEAMARLGRLIVVSNGEYGERLAELATTHAPGSARVVEFPAGSRIDAAAVRRALKSQKSASVFLVAVHHESATGMLNDAAELAALARETGAALFLDAVGSLGAHELDLSQGPIALVAGAPHMALGGLPGIGFVVGERQLFRRLQQTQPRVRSLDLGAHYKWAVERGQMPATPPLGSMLALSAALAELLARGLAAARTQLARRAASLRRGLMRAGFQFPIELDWMSNVVTPILVPQPVAAADLHEALMAHGFVTERHGPPHAADGLLLGHAGEIRPDDLERFVRVAEQELRRLNALAGRAAATVPVTARATLPEPRAGRISRSAAGLPVGTFAGSGK